MNDKAAIVSDGYYLPKSDIATAAWIFRDVHTRTLGRGYCRLPGRNAANDSTRAEIFGLFLCLITIDCICSLHQISEGSITVACDNGTALYYGLQSERFPKATSSHFDLLSAVRRYRARIPITIKPVQVMGHSDKKKPINRPFTILERMNIVADILAKGYAYKCERDPTIQADLEIDPFQWNIVIQGAPVKKHIEPSLQEHVFGQALLRHQQKQPGFSREVQQLVDWQCIEKAWASRSQATIIWLAKWISGFCGTNAKLHQIDKEMEATCPHCSTQQLETSFHIMVCPSPLSAELRWKEINKIDEWLHRVETRWDIRITITNALHNMLQGAGFASEVPENPYNDFVISAAKQQDLIGIETFLQGYLAKDWGRAMEEYYFDTENKRTGVSWSASLSNKIILFARDMWKLRNERKYAKDAFGRLLSDESKLYKRVAYQFDQAPRNLPSKDHHMIPQTMDILLKKSRPALLAWVHHLETVRPYFEEEYERLLTQQRVFIQNWLLPVDAARPH